MDAENLERLSKLEEVCALLCAFHLDGVLVCVNCFYDVQASMAFNSQQWCVGCGMRQKKKTNIMGGWARPNKQATRTQNTSKSK